MTSHQHLPASGSRLGHVSKAPGTERPGRPEAGNGAATVDLCTARRRRLLCRTLRHSSASEVFHCRPCRSGRRVQAGVGDAVGQPVDLCADLVGCQVAQIQGGAQAP